jgi:redox-sensitive bicupin YhaK (pirin superfamily)
MTETRKIAKVLRGRPTIEGAGVHLKRGFAFREVPMFDPFLLFDDFRSNDPEKYLKGFPWHPHRGIETITYVLQGKVEHGDSMGNRGLIGPGDVQWMTAGSGIVHQEMPKGDDSGRMGGFQLWANLPASHKMMGPRYREVKNTEIPDVYLADGVRVRVVCGEVGKTRGPVRDIVTDPEYLDVTVPENTRYAHPTRRGHTVFAYVIDGAARFCEDKNPYAYEVVGTNYFDTDRKPVLANESLVLFGDGSQIVVTTEAEPVRFLLVSGKPIGEPVAWYGPIVMNTQDELRIAFEEYQNGTFIRSGGA